MPSLTRGAAPARALGRLFKREPFRFEQLAFALSLQPVLLARRPDVVYFSEWHTGVGLAWSRRVNRLTFRMVLCNGTMMSENFGHLEHVQQLTPAALDTVLERGADPKRQSMLPLGFALSPKLSLPSGAEREALRERLGLPRRRRIVFSSAALNRHHKRLDYLIEEVSRVPDERRPFVLLAGQPEAETPGVRALAEELLGPGNYSMRTVPQAEVADLCRASDDFILASLGEGLPRALIEAMGYGLSCLTHDYAVTRFALGKHGRFADFSRQGGLAGLLLQDGDVDGEGPHARHRFSYDNFSWDSLRPRYVEMLQKAAEAPLTR